MSGDRLDLLQRINELEKENTELKKENKALKEKATPKKLTKNLLRCPHCNHKVGFDYYDDKHVGYCPTCGQALDWSESVDKM